LHIEQGSARRGGDAEVEPTWQPLVEMPHLEEDLVSIFQDDYELSEGRSAADARGAAMSQEAAPTVLEDTRPFIVAPSLLEDEEPVCDVTLYLAPRATSHFLVGGLAHQIRRWLPEICQTYGWELEGLSVRPDYLRWTLRDFPEVLIREMLQIIRGKTTQRIFRVYPNLRDGAAPDDFWAPGYLVDLQDRDFSTRSLMAHIAQGRLPH
jgi:REP element-mobilizing transposase RayT